AWFAQNWKRRREAVHHSAEGTGILGLVLVRAPPEHEPPLPIHAEPVEDPAGPRHTPPSPRDDPAPIVGAGVARHAPGEEGGGGGGDTGPGKAGPQPIGVAVRAEDGRGRGHAASRCRKLPILADALQSDGQALSMNTSARGHRRTREAAGIGEWLEGAATPIKKGADVSIAPGARLDFAALKGGDISALRQPFLGAPAHLRKALGTRCALNPTA